MGLFDHCEKQNAFHCQHIDNLHQRSPLHLKQQYSMLPQSVSTHLTSYISLSRTHRPKSRISPTKLTNGQILASEVLANIISEANRHLQFSTVSPIRAFSLMHIVCNYILCLLQTCVLGIDRWIDRQIERQKDGQIFKVQIRVQVQVQVHSLGLLARVDRENFLQRRISMCVCMQR